MSVINRGTSGTVLYDLQVESHKQWLPKWRPELALYDAVTSKGFAAGGKRLKMDFAKWDPRARKLCVDLSRQMKGSLAGYKGTDTTHTLQTAAQNTQGAVVAYDFAGMAHCIQYNMLLDRLNAAAGVGDSYVRELLVNQLETFKELANKLLIFGYNAQVIDSCTYTATSPATIVVPAGTSVQNVYIGMILQDTTAVSTTLVSGAPVANYHGLISAITENDDGSTTLTYTHYDGSTSNQFSSSATTAHIHGCYQVVPYGLKDFVTANNTVGDMDRSTYTQYNPQVYTAAQVANFQTDPAMGITQVAAKIHRKASYLVKINVALMSEVTAIWFQKKYAGRLQVQNDQKTAFGYNPVFQVSPSISAFICDSIPDGEVWLMDSSNLGFTPLPGGEIGPDYLDDRAEGIRLHGQLDKETALAWFYQLYSRHLAGWGRIYSIDLSS